MKDEDKKVDQNSVEQSRKKENQKESQIQDSSQEKSQKQSSVLTPKSKQSEGVTPKKMRSSIGGNTPRRSKKFNTELILQKQETVQKQDQNLQDEFYITKKKQLEQYLEENKKDYTMTDKNNGRNFLHKNALDQKYESIKETVEQYEKLIEEYQKDCKQNLLPIYWDEDLKKNDYVQLEVTKYVNTLDSFGNNCFMLTCISNSSNDEIDLKKLENNRVNCLKYLKQRGSDIEKTSNRTLWSPVHWCANYGDKQALDYLINILLLEASYKPDYLGNFPIDIAGQKGRHNIEGPDRKCVFLIVQNYVDMLMEQKIFKQYEKQKNELKIKKNDVYYTQDFKKYIFQEKFKKLIYEGEFRDKKTQENLQIVKALSIDQVTEKLNQIFGPKYNLNFLEIDENKALKEDYQQLKEEFYQQMDKNTKIQKLFKEEKFFKFLNSQLQKLSMLFWSTFYKIELQIIKLLCTFDPLYVEAPMLNYNLMTPIHAAAKNGDIERLYYFITHKLNPQDSTMRLLSFAATREKQIVYIFNQRSNNVLNLSEDEQKLYSQVFLDNIQTFSNWERKYMLNQGERLNPDLYVNYINAQDLAGNTALHLSSIGGFYDCSHFLIQNQASIEIDNMEGWRPRELNQNESIAMLYNSDQVRQLAKQNIGAQVIQFRKEIEISLNQNIQVLDKGSEVIKDLFNYGQDIYIPDFVIKFQINTMKKSKINEGFQVDDIILNNVELIRINRYINFLIQSDFKVTLVDSVHQGYYYLLISCPLKKLEEECQVLGLNIKLIDSYDYQQYDITKKQQFEPFRSRQRQEIIEKSLQKIQNLKDLKETGTITDYYKMHTYGGIARIKSHWVTQEHLIDQESSFKIPVPINFMKDFVLSGHNCNFTALTYLRQYFGERISFFFGWKSYMCCFLFILAVPGTILQIYILIYSDWTSWLLPLWVIYTSIWATMTVEFWKRKTAEINNRWGTLQEMNEGADKQKIMREDFIGCECINEITGENSKLLETTIEQTIYKIISYPILLSLMVCVVGTFFLVQQLQDQYQYDPILKYFPGILQGVIIELLNQIYVRLSNWFTKQENHQYEYQNESVLIWRNIVFKILNSYFSLIFVSFIQDEFYINTSYDQCAVFTNYFDIKQCKGEAKFFQLFTMLLPIIIVKQINYAIKSVLIPMKSYSNKQEAYFNIIDKKYNNFLSMGQGDKKVESEDYKPYQNPIEKFWNSQGQIKTCTRLSLNLNCWVKVKKKKPDQTTQNSEISAEIDQKKIENISNVQDPKEKSVKKKKTKKGQKKKNLQFTLLQEKSIEVDSVELNGERVEFQFNQLIDFYADGFIDLGYIILFAAAFPIGPIVGVISVIIEIRMKIYSFLFVYKRPTCNSSTGIGEWCNIWEIISFISVFSNFALIFFHHTDFFYFMTGTKDNQYDSIDSGTNKIWFFIVCIICLMTIRILAENFTDDKPKWIMKEEEKRSHIQEKRKDEDQKILKDCQGEMLKIKRILNYELDQIYEQIQIQEQSHQQKINQLKNESLFWQNRIPKIPSAKETKSKYKIDGTMPDHHKKEKTIFQQQVESVLKITYTSLERELLTMRLEQINKVNDQNLLMCNDCDAACSFFECINCQQFYCQPCFNKYHRIQDDTSPLRKHEVRLTRKEYDLNIQDLKDQYKFAKDEKQIKYKDKNQNPNSNIFQESREINKNLDFRAYVEESKDYNIKWKKFQYFTIPTYEQGKSFQFIQKLFDSLQTEYISNNGINYETKEINFMKMHKIEKVGQDIYERQTSLAFEMIRDDYEFNVEEKLFLNRIAFITFKKIEKANFDDFLKNCKTMQNGIFEQKMVLLLDFFDEDEDEMIKKDVAMKIIVSSFVQDIEGRFQASEIVNRMFTDQTGELQYVINKSKLWNTILERTRQRERLDDNSMKDPMLKPFFTQFLQVSEKRLK